LGRRKTLILALVALAPWLAAAAESGEVPRRLVVVPFAALGTADARDRIMFDVQLALGRMGYEVIAGDLVDDVLEEERIRYLDSIPPPTVKKLLEITTADAILVGAFAIEALDRDSQGIGLLARVVDGSGQVLWAGTTSLTLKDTEGLFKSGRLQTIDELIPAATRKLLSSFPAPEHRAPLRVWGGSGGGYPRAAGVAGAVPRSSRIALLPFTNGTEDRNAVRTVETLFLARFGEREGIRVVEPGELRAAMIAEGFPSFRSLGPAEFKKLSDRIGTPFLLRGAVLDYQARSDMTMPAPNVLLSLGVTDAVKNRVIWSAWYERNGASFEGLLRLGSVGTFFGVVDRMVADLIETLYDN
jgi:hypothetical protein